jgi:hypothetical protein
VRGLCTDGMRAHTDSTDSQRRYVRSTRMGSDYGVSLWYLGALVALGGIHHVACCQLHHLLQTGAPRGHRVGGAHTHTQHTQGCPYMTQKRGSTHTTNTGMSIHDTKEREHTQDAHGDPYTRQTLRGCSRHTCGYGNSRKKERAAEHGLSHPAT